MGLGAQAAQHTIKKTCDAYTTLKANLKAGNLGKPWSTRYRRATGKPITFRPEGAQPYDDRILSWQITDRTVSLWTCSRGRVVATRGAVNRPRPTPETGAWDRTQAQHHSQWRPLCKPRTLVPGR